MILHVTADECNLDDWITNLVGGGGGGREENEDEDACDSTMHKVEEQ